MVSFTAVFDADYATLYSSSAQQSGAFELNFVEALQTAAPGATVVIDSVVPGSVRVAARAFFMLPASGSTSCDPGAVNACGSLVAMLAYTPTALFATSPMLASVPVSAESIAVQVAGVPQPLPDVEDDASAARATQPLLALALLASAAACI